MSKHTQIIEKDAFNAASIAQARGATAKECLEIGIRHAVQSLEYAWRSEIEGTRRALENEWLKKRQLLRHQYDVIERENKYLIQLISDAKMFDTPPIILPKPTET
jgi:hypothetical protein